MVHRAQNHSSYCMKLHKNVHGNVHHASFVSNTAAADDVDDDANALICFLAFSRLFDTNESLFGNFIDRSSRFSLFLRFHYQ